MSLFQPLTPKTDILVNNITFTEENQAICQQHQEEVNSLYCQEGIYGKTNLFAACSQCPEPQNVNRKSGASFKVNFLNQCYIISPALSIKSSKFYPDVRDPELEFECEVMEHVLCDNQSDGYELKSLVYMKDQRVLAVCSRNGSICFWSIGDVVELKEPKLNLEKNIHFAKYCAMSDDKKYFVVGTSSGLHIYNMVAEEGGVQLLGVVDEDKQVSDVDFLKEENKLIAVSNESIAKVWNLDSLTIEETIDLQKYEIKGKIHTVIYMKHTNELAIEHEKGLSVIDWQSRGDDCVKPKVRHHIVSDKNTYGCMYLAKSKRFILHNNDRNTQVIKEEDFTVLNRHQLVSASLFIRSVFPVKFVSTDDESQILSNSQGIVFIEYKSEGAYSFKHNLSSFGTNLADLELLEDQYRFVAAQKDKGIVTIHRINSNMKIRKGESESQEDFLPVVEYNWTIIDPKPLRGSFSSARNVNNNQATKSTRNRTNKEPVSDDPIQTLKPAKQGKKIQKIEIQPKNEKVLEKKETKRKPKVSAIKSSKKNEIQEEEESPVESVRISRAKKGGKSQAKEEEVWVAL